MIEKVRILKEYGVLKDRLTFQIGWILFFIPLCFSFNTNIYAI
jgi:hypothetical protein